MERRLAAILFTDVVGYTALMGRDESAGRRARARHESVVRALVTRYHGQWIEEKGDESLSIFPSALDAVNCALAIQAQLTGDPELTVRIGVHLGDVTVEGGRVFGNGVNVASRIYPLADPGGICVSGPVCDSIKNQPNVEITSLGERELKNVAAPVAVHAVTGTAAEPPPRPKANRATPPQRAARLTATAGAAVALIVLALWWETQPTAEAASIRSIAVLPLDDPSNDPEQAYFAFGLTEALIAELAKLEDLRVISRTSVTPYEKTTKSITTIAKELGVEAVIEGSVLRVGDRVRITAQLIDARSDTHLWAESYDRNLSDVLALQAEVAEEIARQIHLEVVPPAVGAARSRPISPEAHEAYLKGYYFQMKRTRADTLKALAYFREAIALDPHSALGHAGLADEYSCAPTHSWAIAESELWPSVPLEMIGNAREHAQRAIELDPGSAAGHNSMALVHTYGDWNWPRAETLYRKTLALSPGREWAHSTYALYLAFMRRFDEALDHMEKARAMDPLRVDTTMWVGTIHIWRGERDAAYAQWQAAKEIDPVYPGLHQSVIKSFCGTDLHAEAIESLESGVVKYPGDPLIIAELAYCNAVVGDVEAARVLLRDMQAQAGVMYVSPVSEALVHVGLGETDRAFEALEAGFRDRDPQILYLGLDPTWEPLRNDPRYADLMDRIGLPRG